MHLQQKNGREKISSSTAPGRLERSLKHSSHTNLSRTTVDENSGVNGVNEVNVYETENDFLIKVIWLAFGFLCNVVFALKTSLCVLRVQSVFSCFKKSSMAGSVQLWQGKIFRTIVHSGRKTIMTTIENKSIEICRSVGLLSVYTRSSERSFSKYRDWPE